MTAGKEPRPDEACSDAAFFFLFPGEINHTFLRLGEAGILPVLPPGYADLGGIIILPLLVGDAGIGGIINLLLLVGDVGIGGIACLPLLLFGETGGINEESLTVNPPFFDDGEHAGGKLCCFVLCLIDSRVLPALCVFPGGLRIKDPVLLLEDPGGRLRVMTGFGKNRPDLVLGSVGLGFVAAELFDPGIAAADDDDSCPPVSFS